MKYELTALRLKEAINDKNITAAELSRLSGIGKSSISQYINGTHTPTNISSGKLGKILGVNPVWLMGFDVPKNLQPVEYDISQDDMDVFVEVYKDSALARDQLMKIIRYLKEGLRIQKELTQSFNQIEADPDDHK